jgi:hypothetical protein
MTSEVIFESQEKDCMGNLFTREGTLPIGKLGMKQKPHIEGLPRLDPSYHMIRFFDFTKNLIGRESALEGRDAHGIWIAPASQSMAICSKAADPILSLSWVQTSPFFLGIKTLA